MTVAVFSESTVSASLTLGTVPLARVGPSLTTFKDRLYAFGGRTINPPKVTNDLYLFDLHHMACELVQPNEGSPLPSPRYFHSATMHEDKYLIISGGQGEQTNPDTPNVLNDICIYNIQTNEWEIFELNTTTFPSRYAHLTITKNNHLFIIGGQDADNQYLNDIYTFDLKSKELEKRCSISAGIGSYRSTLSVCPGSNELFVFSNTRFNNPIRELITFDDNLNMNSFQFPQNRSDLPPALRFPEGYIIGDRLVISGTYISNNVQSYSLWTLDLKELTWSRIDTGSCFARGSWNRGVLHPMNNQFLIFGHRDREIVEDYQHRRINFNHISVVNLEAFDIYRKPITCEDQYSVDLGLLMMYEPRYSNFALLTKDGFRIHINSGFLRSRWRNFDTYLTKRQDKDHALGIFSSNTLELQETYSTIQAFVRYLYTDNLDFDQAKNLKVLGKLLIFARNYSVHNLYDQAASHLHSMLDVDNALEIFEVSCTGKRDGLRLRSLSLILKERLKLLDNTYFWDEYPSALRTEILRFMPPNFRPPTAKVDVPESVPVSQSLENQQSQSNPVSRRPSVAPRSNRDSIGSQLSNTNINGSGAYDTNISMTSTINSTMTSKSDSSANSKERPSSTSTLPKKKNSGSSFLKFGNRRPSLANLFNFSSAASSTLIPPSGSTPPSNRDSVNSNISSHTPSPRSPDPQGDAKLIRSLYELGLS